MGHKGKQQQQDADALKQGRQPHYDAQHVLGLRVAISRHALAQHSQVPEAHAPPHSQREEAGEGDQPQTTHLNEQQDHRLPKVGELGPGIPHDQTSNAGSACGGEHGVQHIQPPVLAGNRQAEQKGAQRDHDDKARTDDLRRRIHPLALARRAVKQLFPFCFFHKLLRTRQSLPRLFSFPL